MKQEKPVLDENALLISKREFMMVFAESAAEVLAEMEYDETERIEMVRKSAELSEFGALLTYNLYDGD